MTNGRATATRESFALGLALGTGSTNPTSWKRIVLPNLAGLISLPLLALIPFGMPWQGWALAFSAWLVNRVAHVVTVHFTNTLPVTMAVGATGIAMMFRVWIIAAAFFLAGVMGDRTWALWGIGLFLVLMTVDICIRVVTELKRTSATDPAEGDAHVEEPAT